MDVILKSGVCTENIYKNQTKSCVPKHFWLFSGTDEITSLWSLFSCFLCVSGNCGHDALFLASNLFTYTVCIYL